MLQTIRLIPGPDIEQPAIQLGTQIPPPSCMINGQAFKIIRFHHFYFYQYHLIRYIADDISQYQAIDLFGIIDNESLATNMQKETFPFPQKLQPDREFPVKLLEHLPGTRYQKP